MKPIYLFLFPCLYKKIKEVYEMSKTYNYAPVTLILSREFRPMFFQDIKKAFINYYLNRVQVIEFYPIEVFHLKSVDNIFEVPAVVRSNIPYKYLVSKTPTRLAIFVRDNYTCGYCGKRCSDDEITIDHIVPSSKGGEWSWDNLVTSCIDCNRKKRDNIWYPKYSKLGKIEHFIIQLSKYKNRLHPIIKEYIKTYVKKADVI
jgi:hypothetical protein